MLQIEAMVVVPPIAVMIAKSPMVDEFDLSCVTEFQNGGAPLKADTEREVLSRLPNAHSARQGKTVKILVMLSIFTLKRSDINAVTK